MVSGISDMINSKFRISGLATGLDTDSIVEQMMKVEQLKVDKVKQDKQLLEWKRDDYRSVIKLLNDFKDEFFDVLKPASNMRSESNYKAFTAASSGTDYVTASASLTALAGTHTIEVISALATAASTTGGGTVTKELASAALDPGVNLNGKDFFVNLNGVSRKITISQAAAGIDNLKTAIQGAVDTAFGSGKITVEVVNTNQIKFDSPDGRITLTSGTADALAQLNIESGSTNRLNLSSTLESLNIKGLTFDADGKLKFNINGAGFEFDKTTTLSQLVNTVNSSAANVTLSYSEVTDKFTLTSKIKGAGAAINITNTAGNFFAATADGAASKIAAGTVANGTDVTFKLDGTTITRNDNTFTIDGVTYNLLQKPDAPVTVTVSQDVDGVYNKIKTFVDKYNELVNKLNTELSEERNKDYLPLTDDQRKAMNEDDIKAWEAKAKSGLLRNDSLVSNVVGNMRTALYSAISGVSGNLSSIGITTGLWQEKGKLIIDETKLKDAIKNKPDLVMDLFSKESTVEYDPNLTLEQKKQRFDENGIVNRLYDILQDNIRTTRNSDGKKGILLEKAGLAGDSSEFNSLISKEIDDKNKLINTLFDKMKEKEDRLYNKFAGLESAMSRMNSQSAWLMQQLGGG